jgi:hypothetical protein
MKKEYCRICWYWDDKHESCGNATCPNFTADIRKPDEFACAWFEQAYTKERKNEQRKTI